jgi:quercetin dioxygenase-like cupin family protein
MTQRAARTYLRTHTLAAEHLLLDLGRAEVDLQTLMIDGQDRHGITLVREGGLVVVLVRLRQGASLNEHSAHGAATVLVLSGHIEVQLRDERIDAPTGRLVAFDANVPHEVRALEDTTLLLTLSGPPSGHAAS